jgi:hypothetical protein
MTFCESVMLNTIFPSPKLKEITPSQLRKQKDATTMKKPKEKLDFTNDDLPTESKSMKILLKYYVRLTMDPDDF